MSSLSFKNDVINKLFAIWYLVLNNLQKYSQTQA